MDAHKQREMLERLRAHLEHKTTDLSAYALKVPAEHYVSDDPQALEVDALYKQRPVLVALTPHIPNEGDYLTHEVIDTSLLLVRDSSGEARAYINACRHRGARIAEGKGSKASFSCPFHAWNWGLAGRIIARPNSHDGFAQTDARFDQLLELPCYETAGLSFVLLKGDDIEAKVNDLMGSSLSDIANFDIINF